MAEQAVPIDTRPTHLEVLISGSTLSFLTFKLKNCLGDTEGFLYGHINTRVSQEVSDVQEGFESVHKTITITDFVCFKSKFTFYDKCGRLDTAKCSRVECLTGGTATHARTIGWFTFRRNTTSGMSLREKYIHQGLRSRFCDVVDTFLHFLLVETASNQLVLEKLSMSVSTYEAVPTGRHVLSAHSLRILNLNTASSKNTYKHPLDTAGLNLAHSSSLDNILAPFSEQISTKPPFLQSAHMISQISVNTLDRMNKMKSQILSNLQNIERVKNEIRVLTRDPSFSADVTPSAPPSYLLSVSSHKPMDALPQKTAADYNTFQADKIVNQDPSSNHPPAALFPPLEHPSSQSDQPPPYTHISQGYSGQLHFPPDHGVAMETSSSHVAQATFINNNNNNNKARTYVQTMFPNKFPSMNPPSNPKVKMEREDESSA